MAVDPDDYVSLNRGGTPGDGSTGSYLVEKLSAVQTWLASFFVQKAGDTMSGDLLFEGGSSTRHFAPNGIRRVTSVGVDGEAGFVLLYRAGTTPGTEEGAGFIGGDTTFDGLIFTKIAPGSSGGWAFTGLADGSQDPIIRDNKIWHAGNEDVRTVTAVIGDGVATVIDIPHTFGTHVKYAIRRTSDQAEVQVQAYFVNNILRLGAFATAPATNSLEVKVWM